MQLPTFVGTGFSGAGLAGALPPSLGDLGPSLTELNLRYNDLTSLPTELGALTGLRNLDLQNNAITSVPSEIAALTGMRYLDLRFNELIGVPAEFRTWGPTFNCYLSNNDLSFSCANVGAGTSCCTMDICGDVGTCFQG